MMKCGYAECGLAGGLAWNPASHVTPLFTVGYVIFGICKMLA
jgi:hypothetical protein